MQTRTFRVAFTQIVGEDATELEFGPDDYVVVRPLFGLSKTALETWQERFTTVQAAVSTDAPDAQKLADKLTLDLIGETVIEWHLAEGERAIPKPGTTAALNALPGALAGGLLGFLAAYRGAGANPTTSS
jgi:hypothetical protein